MIFYGRITFHGQKHDRVGPVSVDPNGWVTLWDAADPECVAAMFPPGTVLRIVAEPHPKGGQ